MKTEVFNRPFKNLLSQEKDHLREVVPSAPLLKEWECIYGPHKADVLHRGTAYCRKCYDERNPFHKLIDS